MANFRQSFYNPDKKMRSRRLWQTPTYDQQTATLPRELLLKSEKKEGAGKPGKDPREKERIPLQSTHKTLARFTRKRTCGGGKQQNRGQA